MQTHITRVFLSYAEEDYRCCDLVSGQARTARLGVEFAHMPTKQPWTPKWKAACRARVFQCDGAIVLLTGNTRKAAGVKAEVEYICEAQLPVLGVYMDGQRDTVPEQLRDAQLVEWHWTEVTRFIQSLGSTSVAAGPAAQR